MPWIPKNRATTWLLQLQFLWPGNWPPRKAIKIGPRNKIGVTRCALYDWTLKTWEGISWRKREREGLKIPRRKRVASSAMSRFWSKSRYKAMEINRMKERHLPLPTDLRPQHYKHSQATYDCGNRYGKYPGTYNVGVISPSFFFQPPSWNVPISLRCCSRRRNER